jgi:MFS family permease
MDDMSHKTSEPGQSALMRLFIVAWGCCTVFYFLEYAVRSSPAVMVPELGALFGVSTLGVSSILGTYYYTYASTSLVAGILLDNFGAKYVIASGAFILGIGCLVFSLPNPLWGDVGRLLQGAGSAFAFTGAVYLAAHGFQAQRLATAVGLTQCLGMLGGSAGQLVVGPLIKGHLSAGAFWILIGLLIVSVAVLLVSVTPRETRAAATARGAESWLAPYKVVFSNPQSYLCGAVAGLLFAPTTILDMVWGVRFLQQDSGFTYGSAVFTASMVPMGWVIGCPLLGWVADLQHRRKPALIAGALLMLACIVQLTYLPGLLPVWLTLLFFGIGSGAAMIPYTIIKEVNPDRVKGSAIGAMNFLTFATTAVIGPIFAGNFGKTLGTTADRVEHLRQTNQFWICVVVFALLLTALLRETGVAPKRSPGLSPGTSL